MAELFRKIMCRLLRRRPGASIDIDKKLIRKYLPLSPLIIDCGAHVGRDTIELARIKGAIVYAFEPVAALYTSLLTNTAGIDNVKCFNLALSDANCRAAMYISAGASDGSSSLLKPKGHLQDHPDVTFDSEIEVECMTLDSWAVKNGLSKIDMLWLDMQGSELKMLKASPAILETVAVIHSEVSLKETYAGVEHYETFKAFLLGCGFKVIEEAIPQGFDMGNVLFVRRSSS